MLDFIAEFDTWEDRGVIHFGVIAIDTAGNDDEDEDYFDDED